MDDSRRERDAPNRPLPEAPQRKVVQLERWRGKRTDEKRKPPVKGPGDDPGPSAAQVRYRLEGTLETADAGHDIGPPPRLDRAEAVVITGAQERRPARRAPSIA